MLRSMFSAVAGLQNHQSRMDVVGNNIANVNTPGFKTGRATFQEALNQNIRAASRPTDNRGGTNPMQVGLGMAMASVDTLHTQGSIQETGRPTDLAIDGTGFFVVEGPAGVNYYTRAGAFSWDQRGNLVTPEGFFVQGWRLEAGELPDARDLQPIAITDEDRKAEPRVTGNIEFSGNFAADGSTYARSVTIYDNEGTQFVVDLDFARVGRLQELEGILQDRVDYDVDDLTWDAAEEQYTGTLPPGGLEPGTIIITLRDTDTPETFTVLDDGQGNLERQDTGVQVGTVDYATGALVIEWDDDDINEATADYRYTNLGEINVPDDAYRAWRWEVAGSAPPVEGAIFFDQQGKELGSRVWDGTNWLDAGGHAYLPDSYLQGMAGANFSAGHRIVTDYSGASHFAAGGRTDLSIRQDGYQFGELIQFDIDSAGVITGVYDNGVTRPLMQVALVQFVNPEGLRSMGSTMFAETPNSGIPTEGTAGSAGLGVINPSSLEMSNADMARQFTDMITTQRGFQANARTITASDELLQELVNLVR